MSELRFDPIRRRWVIIAPERKMRPFSFYESKEIEEKMCPFCEGKENLTPPETFVIGMSSRKANSPGWKVRVVPNKFPALKFDINLEVKRNKYFETLKGFGYHEVIIETPNHNYPLWERKINEIRDMLIAIKERIKFFNQNRRINYVLFFGNYGQGAGASLPHPHSQIIALPILPEIAKNEIQSSKTHYFKNKRCLICDILSEELESGERIVVRKKGYIVWEPYASSFPFETWILPENHECDFSTYNNSELERTASILKETISRINKFLKNPPFNLILHTSPNLKYVSDEEKNTIIKSYHWHFEIISRMIRIAGFEWGTGLNINPVLPEKAARCLRKIRV
jgi:UDPglucose--hexose-1-phosphate uridylyltransferase